MNHDDDESMTEDGVGGDGIKMTPVLESILSKLRPFQREAFDIATDHVLSNKDKNNKHKKDDEKKRNMSGRMLLADEMGLGKTVTSLAIMTAYYPSEWPLLILCPASLRHTWPAEIEKFLPSLSPSSIYVISGFDDCDIPANSQVVVATYSLLQKRSASAQVLLGREWKCVICDESHNLKEKSSQRCQLAMPLLKQARRLLLLSGTPALARPVELWSQLHCLHSTLFGSSYTSYTKRYCNAKRGRFGWDVSGTSHMDELHEKLQSVMVRRLKADVLTDLPPKQRSIVPVKIQNGHLKTCRALIKQWKEAKAVLLNNEKNDFEEAMEAHFETKKLLLQAYQASGIAKSPGIAEFVVDWLRGAGTQKVLVFAHHTEVLNIMEATVNKKLGNCYIRIDGTVPSKERAMRVRKFQTNAKVRLALLSVTAAGVGLTLTAASSVIFAELHWTPGVLAQAEDRCHRIGQVNAVNIMYCVCQDNDTSIDLSLWNMLGRKVGTLGRIIDGHKVSMNASESTSHIIHATAEQEVASFFAKNSPSHNDINTQPPVKGSIQSFFLKQTKNDNHKNTSKKNSPVTPDKIQVGRVKQTSLKSHDNTTQQQLHKSNANLKKSSLHSFFGKKEKRTIPLTWECNACTFINNNNYNNSGKSQVCEMCGTSSSQQQQQFVDLTPITGTEQITLGKRQPLDETIKVETIDLIQPSATTQNSQETKTLSPQLDAIIEISDDEDGSSSQNMHNDFKPNLTTSPPKKRKRFSYSNDNMFGLSTTSSSPLRNNDNNHIMGLKNETETLSFSVSRNSGRIAIHTAADGSPLLINFDTEDIISESTSNHFMESKAVKRITPTQACVSKDQITWNDDAVCKIAQDVFHRYNQQASDQSVDEYCNEIKTFVFSYLKLREVEKKYIAEWGKPIKSHSIRKALKTIIESSIVVESSSGKERYVGGFKEKAREKYEAGIASERDMAALEGRACAWCGNNLASYQEGVVSTYCSKECAETGRLRRGGMYASTRIRSQLFTLEGGVCQKCGLDANALFLRIRALEPAERLSALCDANWNLPKSAAALDRFLQNPKEGDFWQADHMLAVAEGGGGCGLENLRTLCTPCHKIETDKLRHRLRLGSVDQRTNSPSKSGSKKNMDIRDAFFQLNRKRISPD